MKSSMQIQRRALAFALLQAFFCHVLAQEFDVSIRVVVFVSFQSMMKRWTRSSLLVLGLQALVPQEPSSTLGATELCTFAHTTKILALFICVLCIIIICGRVLVFL